MANAKDILIKPISRQDADRIIKRLHYSGKVTQGSCLHFGVFLNNKCEGAMQFGNPIDRRKSIALVDKTKWHGMLELNRMAFSENLPRNSESRALSIAFKIIKKNYPHIDWILSFADATQCGDGTIYRAAGFVLTGIKKNTQMLKMPDGSIMAGKTLDDHPVRNRKWWKQRGAKLLPGFQIRYVYFLNKEARSRLTVKELNYSEIANIGAGMYRGSKRLKQAMAGTPCTAAV